MIGYRRGGIFPDADAPTARRGRVPPDPVGSGDDDGGAILADLQPAAGDLARLQAAVARLQAAAIVRSWQTTSVTRLQTAKVAQIAALRGAATCVSAAHTTDGDAAP